MKKKLVIKFWKAEKALAMQILEQEGLPEEKEKGFVRITNNPVMFKEKIYLRGNIHDSDFSIDYIYFETNSDRDEYLDNVIKAITDELFTTNADELKVGEKCEVSESGVYWSRKIFVGKIDKRFGDIAPFMAVNFLDEQYITRWEYARPIVKRTEPKVEENSEVITYIWEEE